MIHAPPRIKADHRAFEVALSFHAGKQQLNAREPAVRSNSAAVGDGMIGFQLIDRAEVAVCQIDGTAIDRAVGQRLKAIEQKLRGGA